jgi:hypothetical protein
MDKISNLSTSLVFSGSAEGLATIGKALAFGVAAGLVVGVATVLVSRMLWARGRGW